MKDGILGYPQAREALVDIETLASRPLALEETVLTDDLWESLAFATRKGLLANRVLAYDSYAQRWMLVDAIHASRIIFADSAAMRDSTVDEAVFHGAVVEVVDGALTTLRQGASLLAVYYGGAE